MADIDFFNMEINSVYIVLEKTILCVFQKCSPMSWLFLHAAKNWFLVKISEVIFKR